MRKIITDKIWSQLEAALIEAKPSVAGAPAEMSDRDFIEAVLYLVRTGQPWQNLPPRWAIGMRSICVFVDGRRAVSGGDSGHDGRRHTAR